MSLKQDFAVITTGTIGTLALGAFFLKHTEAIVKSNLSFGEFGDYLDNLEPGHKAIFWGGIAFLALTLIIMGGSYLYNRGKEFVAVELVPNKTFKPTTIDKINTDLRSLAIGNTIAFDIQYKNGSYCAFEAFKDKKNDHRLTITNLIRNKDSAGYHYGNNRITYNNPQELVDQILAGDGLRQPQSLNSNVTNGNAKYGNSNKQNQTSKS